MSYIQLTIQAVPGNAEAFAEGLEFLDALSVTMTDAQDTPVFQLDPGETPLWPTLKVTALFDNNISPREIIAKLKAFLAINEPINYRIEKVAEQDWVRLTQQHFKPQRYANNLWICPQWNNDPLEGAVVRIDPGLAFGTGTHPTTKLCLDWLAHNPPQNLNVIDYGCGSGILSLAAMALGAKQVAAVDHDEQALIATQNNAALNIKLMNTKSLTTHFPGQCPQEKFDVVIANILANPLIELKETITNLAKPQGTLVLSGILESEVPAITEAYAPTTELESVEVLEQWARLSFIKA